MLQEHTPAPDFILPGSDGREHRLSDHRGKTVVLYFYPKDNTPGCTQEACDFRDNFEKLARQNCIVFGISRDSTVSHTKFQTKFTLNFTLLSDVDLKVHQAYRALDGTKTIRSTFLIDSAGNLAKFWPKVSVKGHVDEVLQAIKALP